MSVEVQDLVGDLPPFDEPKLALAVEALSEAEIDSLPYGAIRLDAAGTVLYYSRAERRLSGSGDRPRIGLNMFSTIAPCMDNDAFRGRVEKARAAGTLDIEFTHYGDFEDAERELTVRIQSSSEGGYWIFMRRES